MSFVIFLGNDAPCLVGMVVGTQGLSPDEMILSRPGHARKIAAICDWLNKEYGKDKVVAWAKQDPTRIDLDMPEQIKQGFSAYQSIFARYGKVLYGIFSPHLENEQATEQAVAAFLDLMFLERGFPPRAGFQKDADRIRSRFFQELLPSISDQQIEKILGDRHFVVLEGPPGTGKTRQALNLLRCEAAGKEGRVRRRGAGRREQGLRLLRRYCGRPARGAFRRPCGRFLRPFRFPGAERSRSGCGRDGRGRRKRR